MKIKPVIVDHEIQRGDTFTFDFDITVDDVVLDLTSATVLSSLKEKPELDADAIVDFTVAVDANSVVTLSLTDVQTANVTQNIGYYDVLIYNGGDFTHYVKGNCTFIGTVTEGVPSSVSMTAPANGSSHTAGTTITVSANATAGTGRTIANVKFYANSTLLNTDSAAPYTYDWLTVPAGTYSLTAVVTDDKESVTSNAVSITVA